MQIFLICAKWAVIMAEAQTLNKLTLLYNASICVLYLFLLTVAMTYKII